MLVSRERIAKLVEFAAILVASGLVRRPHQLRRMSGEKCLDFLAVGRSAGARRDRRLEAVHCDRLLLLHHRGDRNELVSFRLVLGDKLIGGFNGVSAVCTQCLLIAIVHQHHVATANLAPRVGNDPSG